MLERRQFLMGAGAVTTSLILSDSLLPQAVAQSSAGYSGFLKQIYQQAVQQGMDASIMKRALLSLSTPNAKVIQLDRKQPEFTLTWDQYFQKVITPTKIQQGKAAYRSLQGTLSKIWKQYQVDPRIVLGIWGLESAYGKHTGKFNVIDSLATLAFEGRRAKFFKSELMNALKILNNRDIAPEQMLGSYAGAMGQPQFMPSAYLRYAVDFSGTGQRNIWTNVPDVLASIANYLAKCGWKASEPWGQEITIQGNIPQSMIGRKNVKTLGQWEALGVRRKNGTEFSNRSVSGAVIRPDGVGGRAFMVYHNFNVIRRYNPSDYYALGVGLLGDAVA
ncbi:lytic murein transglycosylase [Commensalibacter oyaizuii]|uniref:Lytic murein transglycosylase n=1 Tax=Commensalibacter oyaizuii TaxID=3043873 RepID=A0ABT6PZQ7_9PROT|nr:lytic murein transglycosylase [Commensalibacter sp. TBRC 16381]MDI2090349.1 lytic murein transglycosylase [Commensalibacter sp. TBRC 16381]